MAQSPRVIDFAGEPHKQDFRNGSTWSIRGEVAGLNKSYRFSAAQTLYLPPDLNSGVSVSLRTHSGKSIPYAKCVAWREAVERDTTIVAFFAEQQAALQAKAEGR
jgi:hypothetical protein